MQSVDDDVEYTCLFMSPSELQTFVQGFAPPVKHRP